MNDLVFAQLYYKELNDKHLVEENTRKLEEENQKSNFVSINKRFSK